MDPGRNDIAEFSRPVDLKRLGDEEAMHAISATEAERAALADRFGLISIDSLEATLRLRRVRGGAAIKLSGTFSAALTQACVVTLEPVPQRLDEAFEVLYAKDTSVDESGVGADPALDWPEPMPDGPLDLGEAVAQQLSLSLDPYPRAPGSELGSRIDGDSTESRGPFAGLAALRKGARTSG